MDDVSLAVEQSGEEPPLISSKCPTVRTEKALAEDTRRQECPHDVVGLHAHKGTMWMSNDCVPLKNVESPYGGGVLSLLGAAGVRTPAMFPVAPALLAEGPQLGPWQVAVVRVDETPAGDSSGQDYPCATQNRHRPMDIYELPDSLAHTVVEGGPVGPEVTEPLALLVLDHAALLASMLLFRTLRIRWSIYLHSGGGLVDMISDGEPMARQVLDTTLDSQLMEGITYLERSALGVSLDSRPTEGAPCLEPLEQSVLSSSLAARPVEGVTEKVSDRKPVINPVQNINPDGRHMEGIMYPEHLAPGVSLGVSLVSLVARPQVEIKTSHWKPVINPVMDINTDDLQLKKFPYPAPT